MKHGILAPVLIIILFIVNNVYPQGADFNMHYIDNDFEGINVVKVVDLDMDGDYDIVGGSEHTPYSTSQGLAWWRNDGGNPIIWTKFIIDQSYLHVMSVDVADLNDDTYPDIVASSWENGRISWWKNSGNPTMGWTPYNIKTGWTNAHDAVCYDFNNDNLMDVVGVCAGLDRIAIFYNQGGETPQWSEDGVSYAFNHALSVSIADLNNDSFADIVGAADGADEIAWWKNDGNNPPDWTEYTIASNFFGAGKAKVIDMNFDDQPDIIGSAWEINQVAYWICDDININSWTKNVVTSGMGSVTTSVGSDIDMDGDIDIISIGKNPGKLSIYYNEGFVFTEDVLYYNFTGGAALAIFDLDEDGDDDIIAGAGILGDLIFYQNTTIMGDIETHSGGYRIYPNPTHGRITIGLPLTVSDVDVKIYNSKGVLIHRTHSNELQHELDLNLDVPPGLYMLKTGLDARVLTYKIIIN